jgi:hypothetical protein
MEPVAFTIIREPKRIGSGSDDENSDILFPLNIVNDWQPATGAGTLTYKVQTRCSRHHYDA